MIKVKSKTVAAVAVGMLVVALSGCQKEGPAERAGKELDKTMSAAGEQIQSVGDSIQKAARDAQK
ncbi:MAG TPA: hypothetical protein VL001_10440 [Candidimonas sp.]|nr:hypothetical protein [Candidimonas sp.]